MAIVLYGMERSPPCQAVLVTAKVIGVEIRLKEVDHLRTNDHMTESFLKMNPAHSIPTLDDNGFHIWESRAILGYLVEQYAKNDHLYPKEPKRRALVNNILHFDNGSLYNSFAQYFLIALLRNEPLDPEKEVIMQDKLTILDTILSKNTYAAGDRLTIADISLVASLSLPEAFDYSLDSYTNIIKWRAKVQSEIPHYNDVGRNCTNILQELIQSRISE